MKNRMNKRGMSHIEVILSFVIFLGFLIFLFAIFMPFKTSNGSDVYLDIASREIKNNISAQVNFFTLRLNEQSTGCFYFDYNASLTKVNVQNENYIKIDAMNRELSQQEISAAAAAAAAGGKSIKPDTEKRVIISGEGKFFYIYSYEEFNESDIDEQTCKQLEKEDYVVGLFRSHNMVSFKKLEAFRDSYNLDYESVKKEIGITQDFKFSVRDTLNKDILNITKKVPKTKVFARDEPIQIVYTNGSFKYAILNIQLW